MEDSLRKPTPNGSIASNRLVVSEQARRQSDRTMRALLNATEDTALLIDTSGIVLALNETASLRLSKLAGTASDPLPSDAYVGRCVYELFPDGLAEQRRSRNEEVKRTGRASRFEDERDGRWTNNSIYPVLDDDGRVTRLAIFSADVTERRLAEDTLRARAEQIERLNRELAQSQEELREKSVLLELALEDERDRARRDGLTGVLNHGAIMSLLRERLLDGGRKHRFALAMVDVDDMKGVNDTHGHQVGDTTLIQVASALNRENAIVGRYGGDEFMVLLPDADRTATMRYEEQVCERLGMTGVIDPTSRIAVPVSVSIGFALWPDHASSVAELIARSDGEMYAAKRQRPTPGRELASRRRAS